MQPLFLYEKNVDIQMEKLTTLPYPATMILILEASVFSTCVVLSQNDSLSWFRLCEASSKHPLESSMSKDATIPKKIRLCCIYTMKRSTRLLRHIEVFDEMHARCSMKCLSKPM
jgi:hypothetical protein